MTPSPRLAQAGDVPAIEAIVEGAYSHYVPLMGRKPGPMLSDYPALVRDGRVHVIEDDAEIVGIVVLIPHADHLLIDNVAIRTDCQGRGYGRGLMAFAEAEARRRRLDDLRLFTNEVMDRNIALYRRLGFVETSRGVEHGFKRVFMAKRLA